MRSTAAKTSAFPARGISGLKPLPELVPNRPSSLEEPPVVLLIYIRRCCLVNETEGGLITNYTSNSFPELINLKDTVLIAEKVLTEA